MPQLYVILPVGGGEYPDHGFPGGRPPHIGGGPMPGHPGHPSNRPPGSGDWSPVDPGWGGGWGGGNYPTGGPVPGGERPDNELPSALPKGGEEVPEDVYQPAPIPEEIASQYVVSVYNPKTMQWTTKSYAPR